MILMLEIIMLIVYGLFCFVVIKSAERTNKKLRERNARLNKKCRLLREENDRLHYESATFSNARNARIEVLKLEIEAHKLTRKELDLRLSELKQENLKMSVELQKLNSGTECHSEIE